MTFEANVNFHIHIYVIHTVRWHVQFLRLTAKWSGKWKHLPSISCLQMCIVSAAITIPRQSGPFVTTEESTLIDYYRSVSAVYIMIHLGWSTRCMDSLHHPKFITQQSSILCQFILPPAGCLFIKSRACPTYGFVSYSRVLLNSIPPCISNLIKTFISFFNIHRKTHVGNTGQYIFHIYIFFA